MLFAGIEAPSPSSFKHPPHPPTIEYVHYFRACRSIINTIGSFSGPAVGEGMSAARN